MSSRRPDYDPGQFYHIYNRGAHGVSIFREQDNYLYVLRKVKRYAVDFSLSVIAYCLMPNHYHFLVRQEADHGAGLLPQRVFNSYSKAYNLRYQHSGTLFQGPYQAIHITQESHLLHLCRYIHANPVKDGLVSGLEDWPYSNYLEWIGARPGVLVDREFVQAHFPEPCSYADFVGDFLKHRTLPEEVRMYLERLEG
ncbi:MAG: transposase [Chloroflexota bacterium]